MITRNMNNTPIYMMKN